MLEHEINPARKLTLAEWLDLYGRHRDEDEGHVIAECTCEEVGYNPTGTCHGWVLTMASAVYPHERLLSDAERAAAGLAPYPHPTRGVYDDDVMP